MSYSFPEALTSDSRLILHIVLAKLYISFTTMLLYMSEDSAEYEPRDSGARWNILPQEEKRHSELLTVSSKHETRLIRTY